MTLHEQDILERIRALWSRSEDKKVAKDIVKKEDTADDLTTADLAQTGETEAARTREGTFPQRESTVSRSAVREGAPNTSMQTGQTATSAVSTGAAVGRARRDEEAAAPLFSGDEANNLRFRWESVQVGFVDEPRRAVEQADHLVAETIKRLAEMFADERQRLERQWDRGENISTEDLRLGLRRYRAFFERLLAV